MCKRKPIETDEQYAKRAGYRVILTDLGWVVVSPREKIDDEKLASRPDSRQKFGNDRDAWAVAAIRAMRAGKKR
jgi:hypothetical protein